MWKELQLQMQLINDASTISNLKRRRRTNLRKRASKGAWGPPDAHEDHRRDERNQGGGIKTEVEERRMISLRES